MPIIALLLLGISALNFFLALLFFSKGFKNASNLFFAIFILAAGVWPLAIAFFSLSENYTSAYFWNKIIYISGTIVPFSFIFFARLFTQKTWPKLGVLLLYILLPMTLTFLLLFSDFFVRKIDFYSNGISVKLGWAYTLWVIYFCLYMALGSLNLFQKFRKSSGLQRLQLSYIIIALFFPVAGALPFNIFLPLFGRYDFIYLGPFGLTLMVGIITYAIIRHRLMDIRFVAARTIAYSLLLVIISAFYVSAAFLLSTTILGITAGFNQIFLYTVLTIFVALSFDSLKHSLERVTDKIFFKGRYNSEELLSHLGSVMSTNIELDSLTNQILRSLAEQMRISKGAFSVLAEETPSIYYFTEIGFPQDFKLLYKDISPFLTSSETIVFDDLEENNLKNIMRGNDISIIKSLKVKNKVVAILLLGEKASGEIYSNEDLKILEILSGEMAVAIQNSLAYDKIKRFNVILSEEVKKATSELQDANDRLKALDRLKDDFVSIASHELRTPMTAIRSYAWMALNRSDMPLSQTLEKYITRILISTERLINLVNDMLNVSRIEAGRVEINPEPVDLMLLVKDIIDEVYFSKSEEKQVEFVVLEKPVPKVFADPEKLRQVFLNLVGNSLKFTPAGGKITFSFFSDGHTVEISVTDTGVGISQEDISKLFNKFSRLDTSYTAAATSGGTGLGLYISKNLIQMMQGKIKAYSEGLGKGATFTVCLPAATPQALKDIDKYTVKVQGQAKELEPATL